MPAFRWEVRWKPPDKLPDIPTSTRDSDTIDPIELHVRCVWREIQARTNALAGAAAGCDGAVSYLNSAAGISQEIWTEIQEIQSSSPDLLLESWVLLKKHRLLLSDMHRNVEANLITDEVAEDLGQRMFAILQEFRATKISGSFVGPSGNFFQGAHGLNFYGGHFVANTVNQAWEPDPVLYKRFMLHLVLIQTLLF
ncbi:hypothetical protein NLJ89_g6841 [Agrocybe chaxingu]|uniref:Uncharacterized protein n=1 Tax=Agrocybe chaxingu TaxID=84603 RepID=A0A9W8JVN8_9AGAR|nr:hypothetical protein NLJ89_g6841 [Agrocybe chaxingu]